MPGSIQRRYETQQMECQAAEIGKYESLSKGIEFQNLEIQYCEKRIKVQEVILELKTI